MALTAYCKKCKQEVPPGEVCPRCGTRLAKTATHAAWVMERRPVTDWMCWNAVMRWMLPAGLAVFLLVLATEGISGGLPAIESLFRSGFPLTMLIIFCALTLLVLLDLVIQGKELLDYVIDSRGVHVTRYLPSPSAWKLLARGKSPRMMEQVDPESESPILKMEEKDLPWRAVARVQLWPEKCYILFYAPAWWLRIPVRATPFSWEDALFFVRDKLGRKKAVELPAHLRTPKAPAAHSSSPRRRATPAQEATSRGTVPEETDDFNARHSTPHRGANPAPENGLIEADDLISTGEGENPPFLTKSESSASQINMDDLVSMAEAYDE